MAYTKIKLCFIIYKIDQKYDSNMYAKKREKGVRFLFELKIRFLLIIMVYKY